MSTIVSYKPVELKIKWRYQGPDNIPLEELDAIEYTTNLKYNTFEILDVNLIDAEDEVESLWTATAITRVQRPNGHFTFNIAGNDDKILIYAPDKQDYMVITHEDIRHSALINKDLINKFAAWYCPNKKPYDAEDLGNPDSDMPDIF